MNNLIKREQNKDFCQTMTSLEIAELTGKQHKHLMEAIRKMEPAWVKVHGSKFRLMFREVAIGNGAVRRDPCYQLTNTSPRSSTMRRAPSWCCAGRNSNCRNRNATSNWPCPVRRKFSQWRMRSSARDCDC